MAGLAHHASGSPVPLSMVGPAVGAAAGYPHAGAGTAGAGGGGGTKKIEPLGAAGVGLEGQLLASEYIVGFNFIQTRFELNS